MIKYVSEIDLFNYDLYSRLDSGLLEVVKPIRYRRYTTRGTTDATVAQQRKPKWWRKPIHCSVWSTVGDTPCFDSSSGYCTAGWWRSCSMSQTSEVWLLVAVLRAKKTHLSLTTPRNASVNVARFRQSNKQRDFCIESALDKDDVRSRWPAWSDITRCNRLAKWNYSRKIILESCTQVSSTVVVSDGRRPTLNAAIH